MPASAVRVLRAIADDEQTDAELLGRFIDRRDEAAFALLVRRHGAMVYGVCRRMLPEPDAEDAFQAVFLVLAQKARTAAPREVANWLYGVARRAALLSRRSLARRKERTGDMPDRPAPEPNPLAALLAALDDEMSRLPDVYRTVVVLCDLEGRTRREAAGILGWPEGTVAGRLARARGLLAKRLARHAPAVSVAAILAGSASARVPEAFATTATAPPAVATLTREILTVMVRGKLMKTAAVVVLVACAGFGMVLRAGQTGVNEDAPVSADVPANKPRADDVAWGEEIDGLRLGLSLPVRTFQHGETMKMEVKVRNVGKAEVTITHGRLEGYAPNVTDAGGGRKTVALPRLRGIVDLNFLPIKPGATVTLDNPVLDVASEDALKLKGLLLVRTPTTYLAPGKYNAAFRGLIQSHPKLATGAVGFEVKDATAWGKEVGGLQAGLTVREKRTYRTGETVKVALRIRNVGKEGVEFTHIWAFFVENTPTIIGPDGATVKLPGLAAEGLQRPRSTAVAPGKEVEVYEWSFDLLPKDPIVYNPRALRGAGTWGLRCDRVVGPTSGNPNHPNPALEKLATGTLEFDVTYPQPPALHLPTNTGTGFRELKGKEMEAYETTNAWLEERMKEAQSIQVGSTYADVCKSFRTDGGLTQVGKHRFVNVLCPFVKLDIEFEGGKGGTPPPAAKVTKVSRPYFEREFAD